MKISIPLYNLVNMLFTGALFWVLADLQQLHGFIPSYAGLVVRLEALPQSLMVAVFCTLAYGIGLSFNRIGATLIECILRRLKWISYDENYVLYQKQRMMYPILDTLSREYALSRTLLTEFLILTVVSFFCRQYMSGIVDIAFFVVYVFSARKYSERICQLVEEDPT